MPDWIKLLFALLLPATLGAGNPITATRLAAPIDFDGKTDDKAWQGIPELKLQMQVPNFGVEPTEKSIVKLAYDDHYLYLSGRMYLSSEELYRATTFKRDAFDGTTDYFGMVIDSYNDNENGLAFFTTPTGLRWDGSVANDAQADPDISIDWNTFWDVKSHKTEDGWSVEMRIPWSSLRFQDRNGEVTMGITVWWYIAAKNEVGIFPLIPLNWGGVSMWKPSQAQRFVFKGVYSHKPLYLTPYVLAGYQQNAELNDDESAYLIARDPRVELGFDLKYSLTSNLTLDLTANTDFAQVEADDQQVNLTRFSLFFPEKRQFFQERASIFDFSFENFNRLFYSRRIGINDDGDAVRIYGGARLQGRVGANDLGFLALMTEAPQSGGHSESFSILRTRRQVFNQYSYLGLIGTNRTDLHGNFNRSYGLDGIFRVIGDEYLTVKWVQTFEDSLDNEFFSLDPARIFVQWEHRRFDGLAYKAAFSRAGSDYNPAMGFEERGDFHSGSLELSYGVLPKEISPVLRWRALVRSQLLQNNTTDTVELAFVEPGFELETRSGWNLTAGLRHTHEYIPEAFGLGDATIPVGEYDYLQFNGFVFTPFGGLLGAFGNFSVGQFYDGKLLSMSLSPRYKVSPHFTLEGFYQYNRADFAERNDSFHSHIGRLKAEYQANTRFSVSAFLQYNSLDELFLPNVRLRYNPKEGNDLYIVFNDLLNSNRSRKIPHLPRSDSRTIVVKYTYTFTM